MSLNDAAKIQLLCETTKDFTKYYTFVSACQRMREPSSLRICICTMTLFRTSVSHLDIYFFRFFGSGSALQVSRTRAER